VIKNANGFKSSKKWASTKNGRKDTENADILFMHETIHTKIITYDNYLFVINNLNFMY